MSHCSQKGLLISAVASNATAELAMRRKRIPKPNKRRYGRQISSYPTVAEELHGERLAEPFYIAGFQNMRLVVSVAKACRSQFLSRRLQTVLPRSLKTADGACIKSLASLEFICLRRSKTLQCRQHQHSRDNAFK